MARNNTDRSEIDIDDFIKLLEGYELNKNELRRSIRPAAQYFLQKMTSSVGKGWGVRTGRMHGEGVKMGVATSDEGNKAAAYRVYFSRKKGTRGKADYIAPTFVARWLEGGTRPHYTARNATIKKVQSGRYLLSAHTRKLKHPGFAGRPVAEDTQKKYSKEVENISRNNIMYILRKKGADK